MQTYPPAAVRPASAIHAQRTQPYTHYERRRPETTVLHLLVREHIDTFLAQVKTESGAALPHHVEKEFDDYLRCGVLAHGFLRLRCGSCSEEKLVGFSCKGRGFCPSCGARRMAHDGRDAGGRATQEQLPRPPRIWSIKCCPMCRCANGCCRFRSRCATSWPRIQNC